MPKKNFTAVSNAVYEQLRQQILYLDLPPQTMISEIETSEKYNVSRTPVRDAFKRLEIEQLVEIRPQIGTFVSKINLEAVSDMLFMREVIECAVLSDPTLTLSTSIESQLQALLQEQKDLLVSDLSTEELSRAFITSDNRFHDTLFQAAGKSNIRKQLAYMNSQYERFRTLINYSGKHDLEKLCTEHETIINLIKEHDSDGLKLCIKHHINDGFLSRQDIIATYPDYFSNII